MCGTRDLFAMSGQVAGRIDTVIPVAQILEESWRDCRAILDALGARARAAPDSRT